MNGIKKKVAERSTEELIDIIKDDSERYPKDVLKIIEEVLKERDVDVTEIRKEEYRKLEETDSSSGEKKVKDKYRGLKLSIILIKIASVVFLAIGGVFSFLRADGNLLRLLGFVLITVIMVIPYYALTLILKLFMGIEENTKETKELLVGFFGKNKNSGK